MAQVHRERANLQAQLGHTIPGGKLTSSQVRALVDALRDIVTVLAEADPQDKADLYGELGVNLTYHPEGRVQSRCIRVGLTFVSEGGLQPQVHATHGRPGWSLREVFGVADRIGYRWGVWTPFSLA